MPVSPSWPGVYVQEVPSGVRTIAGVGTSIALFVGYVRSGPVNSPRLFTSYTDYTRTFGEDVTAGDMTRQVKLFFLNGGTQCYVMRVAEGSAPADVTLRNQADDRDVLHLTARNHGVAGDLIRASVTYSGAQPEDTFNLELFRWEALPNGTLVSRDAEVWRGLSMDPTSGAYAPDVLTTGSKLVTATANPLQGSGRSYAMRPYASATAPADIAAAAAGADIEVSVDRGPYVSVPVRDVSGGTLADYANDLESVIDTAFSARALPAPGLTAGWEDDGTTARLYLERTNGDVFVRRAGANPGAANLQWGTDQGGIEVTSYAASRPAANGVTLENPNFALFSTLVAGTGATVSLNAYDSSGGIITAQVTASWPAGASLLAILGAIRDAINTGPTLAPGEVWPWSAELWGHRLAIRPTNGPLPAGADDNRVGGLSGGDALAGIVDGTGAVDSPRYYSLGPIGAATYQVPGAGGLDGTSPTLAATYDNAYAIVRREVDLFNLLILPRSADESSLSLESLWANASLFAQERRALLLMEPPLAWTGVQQPMNGLSTLRIGLSKQYAALYYPNVTIQEGRIRLDVGATGAIAGLMARTDASRGVWKAPAGTEADLRGIVGLKEQFSDPDNGVLNPRGLNMLRAFPNGIVSWGARTMDGDDGFASEYKYVPVRRLALYLEESLYRGLKWAVFEGNDDTLWAQIRLNVGAFMQGLYRQGAFQGRTPNEAYFVKCDAETTTQNDINLGIVNVWVGFAPLKPAEFVILSLQQMAGQLEI